MERRTGLDRSFRRYTVRAMAYTVLARRYRSQSFDEVVGQEAIAGTLRTAIKQNRVAHAYLFTGTRGVGKTSMARIFARALNAVDDSGKENPDIAAAIMRGQDTDVIEIDAASNTGVDNARDTINNAYRPMRGRKKVYIIDEVHMLTTQAFNALLKTMEEPPEHVVFILCTTETHKVPATIQSRLPAVRLPQHCNREDRRAPPRGAQGRGHQRRARTGAHGRAAGQRIDARCALAAGPPARRGREETHRQTPGPTHRHA